MSTTPVIKEVWSGFSGNAGIFSRRYITEYEVTGLDCGVDARPQILPTASSVGLFPLPGSFPTTMPDGRALVDTKVRVESVEVKKAWAGGAIVRMEMISRLGDFDVEGAFLLDMRIGGAIEWIPSNYDIDATTGEPNNVAQVRYKFTGATGSGSGPGSGQVVRTIGLSIPRNRKTVTIVQSEPASFNGMSHLALAGKCSFVNSATFWGGAPRTWLCTALEPQWTGFPDLPWNTTYQFVYKPEQWTEVAYFQDQNLNIPFQDIQKPANFNPGTESVSPYGAKVFRIAGEFDFTTLSLPNITSAG